MCGIVGVINLGNNSKLEENILSTMVDLLSHRGPNDKGIFIDEYLALGHRRLSILDLSLSGHQPMSSLSRNVWIVYNGEVYNFEELRRELIERGHRFRSFTDTEVVLNAYVEYGIVCLEKFRGMFAFAIYDKDLKKVFIVRDRIGVKPIYYGEFDGRLIFASEAKAILKYPGFPRKEDLVGMSSYLSYRYPIHEYTMFRGIKTLLPGHYLEVDLIGKDYQIHKYWDLPMVIEDEDKGLSFYLYNLKRLLRESVKYRMIADVPVGAYLSGGLDSSIVVALMAKSSQQPVKTFTIGFEDQSFNEFNYATEIAQLYGTEHTEILLTSGDYFEEMCKLINYKDAPLGVPNEPALYVMSKELSKHITVVLSGEGSDEIFGGYGRIFRSAYDYKKISLFNHYGHGEKRKNTGLLMKLLGKNLQRKYGSISFRDEVDFFLSLYKYTSWEEKKLLLSEDVLIELSGDGVLDNLFREYFSKLNGLGLCEKFMWMFEKVHIVGLLYRLDTATMAASIEGRVPFVDHKLVEFAMSIPAHYKLKWKSWFHRLVGIFYNADQLSERFDIPKYILRKAFESYLPTSIVRRKKMGFPVPINKWLGKDFLFLLRELLLSSRARSRGIYNIRFIESVINRSEGELSPRLGLQLWMLLNIELWFLHYMDNQ